jgi:hypothetical protein
MENSLKDLTYAGNGMLIPAILTPLFAPHAASSAGNNPAYQIERIDLTPLHQAFCETMAIVR